MSDRMCVPSTVLGNPKKFPEGGELIYTLPVAYESSIFFSVSPVFYIFYPFHSY